MTKITNASAPSYIMLDGIEIPDELLDAVTGGALHVPRIASGPMMARCLPVCRSARSMM